MTENNIEEIVEETPSAEELGFASIPVSADLPALENIPELGEIEHFEPLDMLGTILTNTEPEAITEPKAEGVVSEAIEVDRIQQVVDKESVAASILQGEGDPSKRTEAATLLLQHTPLPRTPGSLYRNTKFPDTPTTLSDMFDKTYTIDQERKGTMSVLGQDPQSMSYKKFINTPQEEIDEIIVGLINKDVGKIIPLKNTTLRFDTDGNYLPQGSSLQEFVDFVNVIPVDESVDVDFLNFVKLVLSGEWDIASGDFGRQAEARYGKQWEAKFMAFALKEVGVDMLFLTSKVFLKGAGHLYKNVMMNNRFKKALIRMTSVGIGGGSVQAALNGVSSGDQDINLFSEILLRFAGEGAGELLVAGAGKVFGKGEKFSNVKKEVIKELAEETNKAIVKDTELLVGEEIVESLHNSVVIAEEVAKRADESPDLQNTIIDHILEGKDLSELESIADIDNLDLLLLDHDLTIATLKGQTVGYKVIGEVTTSQRSVDDIFTSVLDSTGSFTFRSNPWEKSRPDSIVASVSSFLRIGEAEDIFGNIFKDYFDVTNLTGRYTQAFNLAQKEVVRDLNKKQVKQLNNILDQGNNDSVLYSVNTLRAQGFDENIIDSYFAMRKMLDRSSIILDAGLVKQARNKGYKKVGDTLVIPTGTKFDNGLSEVRVIGHEGQRVSKIPTTLVATKSIVDIDSVLSFKVGYIPRVYKDSNFHVSIWDTATHTLNRVGGFKSRRDAIKHVRKVEKDLAKTGDNKTKIIFFDKWSSRTGISDVAMNKRSRVRLRKLKNVDMVAFKNSLEEAGMAPGAIENISFTIEPTHIRAPDVVSGRGKHRTEQGLLGNTPKKVAIEAITDYMSDLARIHGETDWRIFAQNSAVEKWKSKGIKLTRWDDEITDEVARGVSRRNVMEAKRQQAKLKKVLTGRTSLERTIDTRMDVFLTEMIKSKNLINRNLGVALDKAISTTAPTGVGSMLRGMRKSVAYTKLLSFNTSQIFVQSSQALLTVSARMLSKEGLQHISGGMQDASLAIAGNVAKKTGTRTTKEAEDLISILERSGYIADLNTNDMANLLRGNRTLVGNVLSSPFKAGEAINRILAFTVSRREMMTQALNGTLKGIDGNKFVGKIDDDEFLRLVTDRAKLTALNMGKAGELEAFSGLGSVIFQFWQVAPKMLGTLTRPGMSVREKMGMAAGLMGMYGTAGIPFGGDLLNFADFAGWELGGNKPSNRAVATEFVSKGKEYLLSGLDEDYVRAGTTRNFMSRLIDKGLLNALTDGEVDIVNRVSVSLFLSQYSNQASFTDYVPFLSLVKQVFGREGAVPTVIDVIQEYWETSIAEISPEDRAAGTTPLTLPSAGVQAMRGVGKAVTSIGNFNTAIANVYKDTLNPDFSREQLGTFGEDIAEVPRFWEYLSGGTGSQEVTPWRLAMKAIGINPGVLTQEFDEKKLLHKLNGGVSLYFKEMGSRYKAQTRNGEIEIRKEVDREIVDFTKTLRVLGLEDAYIQRYGLVDHQFNNKFTTVEWSKVRGR